MFKTVIPKWLSEEATGRFYLAVRQESRNRSPVHTVTFPKLPTFTFTGIEGTAQSSSRLDGNHYVISGEVLLEGRVQAGSSRNRVSRIALFEYFPGLGNAQIFSQAINPPVDGTRDVEVPINLRTLLNGKPVSEGYHYLVICVYDQNGECGNDGPVEVLVEPPPDTTPPALKRFRMDASGHDALLGNYSETVEGQAGFNGSLLQLWSDSETPNRVLEITYLGGGTIPVGSYRAVGSAAGVVDPTKDVVVSYLLSQDDAAARYYFEYFATEGTLTITKAGDGQVTGWFSLRVERYDYHAELGGAFDAAQGR